VGLGLWAESPRPRASPSNGRAIRVLDLEPITGRTGAVGRAEALRYDALQAHHAGLPEYQFAHGVGVLVESYSGRRAGQQPRQAILALAERSGRRSLPLSSSRSNAWSCGAWRDSSIGVTDNVDVPLRGMPECAVEPTKWPSAPRAYSANRERLPSNTA
jgi:hypothetical protein